MRNRIHHAMAVLASISGLLLGPVDANANDIKAVKVSQGPENTQVVRVSLSEPLSTTPMHFTTTNPPRLVLDFVGVRNPLGRIQQKVDDGLIRSYNVVQASDRTRVVIDLAGPATYDLRQEKNVLLVALRGSGGEAGAADAAHFPSSSAAPASVRDVSFRRGQNGESRIEVDLSEPGIGIDIKQKGQTIQVDFLNTHLPEALQRRLDVSEFATPAQTVETYAQGKATRMIVKPKGKWDYFAYQTGRSFILEVTSLDGPAAKTAEKAKYSGEKLSLDFQNVEIRSVLKVIADFTGLNIIAADSVGGSITVRLKDVPWDHALDIILRSKGLDKRVSGNVIWVEPTDALLKKEEDEKRARQSNEQLEPLSTRNYRLNYIRADEAMTILSGSSRSVSNLDDMATCSPSATGIKTEASSAGASTSASSRQSSGQGPGGGSSSSDTFWATNRVLSARGAASFDLTTNTLIVTDIADRHTKVEDVLKGIDVPSKQVMIEARLVLADDSFGRHIGARLGFQTRGKFGDNTVGLAPGGVITSSAYDVPVPHSFATTDSGLHAGNSYNVDLPTIGLTAPSLGFTLINAAAESIINLELQALEADSRGKIVSNPKVITTNLKPAVILQGEQIPYQTISESGTQTSFKDALLCLLVAPQVLNNDDIILNVEVTKDARGQNTEAGPAINVKRVKTQVRVKNGETAVLGGIFEQTQRNDGNKVPLLGDIPLLGVLFRNNSKSDIKSEMLIFLTPRLLQ